MSMHEFDKFAKGYHKRNDQYLALSGEGSFFWAQYKAKKLIEWLPQCKNKPITICDFGCGDGVMTNFVSKELPKAHVHAVDPSSESINLAQERFPYISFSVSGNNIPFENQTFDLVYAAGVFHHIPFTQHEHYFNEVMRILKPGGHLVIFELNPYNLLTRFIVHRNPIDHNAKLLRPAYTIKNLKSCGAVRRYYYGFFPGALRKLRFLEPYLSELPLGGLYCCIAQKK